MPKFRSKPCVIEAEQFTDESKDRVYAWMRPSCSCWPSFGKDKKPIIEIDTPEGRMTARFGDWIVKGTHGEFYPVKPEVFAVKYEIVPETETT